MLSIHRGQPTEIATHLPPCARFKKQYSQLVIHGSEFRILGSVVNCGDSELGDQSC